MIKFIRKLFKGQDKEKSNWYSVSFRAEEGFIEELNRLAEASGTTRLEVIDRAIRLYATALEATEQGKTIKILPSHPRKTNERQAV
jgi:hypothetical protein